MNEEAVIHGDNEKVYVRSGDMLAFDDRDPPALYSERTGVGLRRAGEQGGHGMNDMEINGPAPALGCDKRTLEVELVPHPILVDWDTWVTATYALEKALVGLRGEVEALATRVAALEEDPT